MGVKVDYANKIDTSAINPVNASDGIDVFYLTGAGYIDYPFRGISRDSALGWEEATWGGDLTRSTNFVLTNITDVNYGLVARLELDYKYMNVQEYRVLMEISKQRVCYATYFNRETGKWIVRQEMAFTGNELGKLYAFGVDYIGTMDVKIKLVATNRDKVDKVCSIHFDKNNENATGEIADYQVKWSANTSYEKALMVEGNSEFIRDEYKLSYFSTNSDGTGLKFLPNQEITIFDDLTLYAQWQPLFVEFDSDWLTQYENMGGNTYRVSGLNFAMQPSDDYPEFFGIMQSGIKIYRNSFEVQSNKTSNRYTIYNILFVSDSNKIIRLPQKAAGLFGFNSVYGFWRTITFPKNVVSTNKTDDMSYMFSRFGANDLTEFDNLPSASIDLSAFDTSKVTNMLNMFNDCFFLTSITLGDNFDTSNVTNMSAMFSGCKSLTSLDVSNFDTSNVMYMYSLFYNCSSLTSLDLSGWDISNAAIGLGGIFDFGTSAALTKLVLPSNWGSVTSLYIIAGQDLYSLNTGAKVTTGGTDTEVSSGYAGDTLVADVVIFPRTWEDEVASEDYMTTTLTPKSLTKIQFETIAPTGYTQIGTLSTGIEVYQNPSVTTEIAFVYTQTIYAPQDCDLLFYALNLTSLTFDNFDTSKVTGMNSMFSYCRFVTSLDVSGFDTSNVTDMNNMFSYCNDVTSLDLSNFDTSSVTSMSNMFANCSSLTELDVSNFDTSKITDIHWMFKSCSSLTSLNLSSFEINNVTNMRDVFELCSSLQTLQTPMDSGSTHIITLPVSMYDQTAGVSVGISYTCTTTSHTLVAEAE